MRRRRRRCSLDDDREEVSSTADAWPPEPLASRLLAESKGDPASIALRLATADETSQARALRILQRDHGNAFVESVVRTLVAGKGRAGTAASSSGSGTGAAGGDVVTLERQADDEDAEPADATTDEVEELADIPEGATEEVGPATSSSYSVAAASLSDVASQLSSRDEAGYCGWKEAWTYNIGPTGRIAAVKVKVAIDIEMPAWTPPPSMLPKTKAEWERSYAALLAHEQGHERLVHEHFDGLADKILGKTVKQGKALFDGAKSSLSRASKAYDARTGHGTKTGTIIDTSIEQRELDEKKREEDAKRKKAEAERSGKKAEAETPAPAETPA